MQMYTAYTKSEMLALLGKYLGERAFCVNAWGYCGIVREVSAYSVYTKISSSN